MRHLMATLYLKDHPKDYTGLATLLMDELTTVTNIYAGRNDKENHEEIESWNGSNLDG